MASTLVDEQVMQTMLAARYSAQEDVTCRLQFGGALLILDAFDRKVTREEFIKILEAAIDMTDVSGRVSAFHAIRKNVRLVTAPEVCDGAIVRLQEAAGKKADRCVELAKLLVQCPSDGDAVN